MLQRFQHAIAVLPILVTAFMPLANDDSVSTEYQYNLRNLRESGAPRTLRLISITNSGFHKKVFQQGVLITYKNRDAKKVKIAGDFTGWQLRSMEKNPHGVWHYFLTSFSKRRQNRYKFNVDGVWMADPRNRDNIDDGSGSYVSTIVPVPGLIDHHTPYRMLGHNKIEFRIYEPNARLISLVGDFNNWNPENDLLHKGPDGIWRLKKRLPPGKYRYKYIIDGAWKPDVFNGRSASDDIGGVCSVIEVK